jgi:hypothetical protein
VKVPLVEQFVVPDAVQLPLMVPPFTVPVRTNESFEGAPDDRLSWKLPLTLPLKFPLKTNEAVSVAAVNEQELVVKFKFVTVTVDPLLAAVSEVVKANTGTPLASCRAAVQLPLIFPELLLEEPQPARVIAATRRIATANCFIRKLLWEIFRRSPELARNPLPDLFQAERCSLYKSWSRCNSRSTGMPLRPQWLPQVVIGNYVRASL